MADIIYTYKNEVYANITNKCDCACTFCIRSQKGAIGDATSLWHTVDPTYDEIIAAIDAFDFTGYEEFVFCGYGEPTCALDILEKTAKYVKEKYKLPIRVNTNGLGNLYHGRDIVPELAEYVDSVSISLNAANAEEYNKVTRPTFDNAYEAMLDFHKQKNADVTIAAIPVPMEEASRFGVVLTDEDKQITEFEEKPEKPSSNLASMGIYIFSWPVLRDALIKLKDQPNCDFGKHVIPYCHSKGDRLFAYEYNGYWKDVGTLSSYWEANMELIDIIPEFNLYEEYWKIYTNSANLPPQYISEQGVVDKCLIGNGSEIYGEIHSCVVGGSVTVGKGTVIRDSIIMQGVTIGENCVIDKAIIAEDTVIGDEVSIGIGSEAPNKLKPNIYSGGLATIGEKSVIPSGVQIGKNTAISGVTSAEDYVGGVLESGETLIKAGERV